MSGPAPSLHRESTDSPIPICSNNSILVYCISLIQSRYGNDTVRMTMAETATIGISAMYIRILIVYFELKSMQLLQRSIGTWSCESTSNFVMSNLLW